MRIASGQSLRVGAVLVSLGLLSTACQSDEAAPADSQAADTADTTASDDTDTADDSTQTDDSDSTDDSTADTAPETASCELAGQPCTTGLGGACAEGLGVCVDGVLSCELPDRDADEVPDCRDGCPDDPLKLSPGACGCGIDANGDSDRDGDGAPDCDDGCPDDPLKTLPGACGCDVPDTDTNEDGVADCAAAPTCSDGLSCEAHAHCEDTPLGPTCACDAGYEGAPCADVDECAWGAVCGALRTCVNTPGGFDCPCDPGFTDDGQGRCVDLDECATNTDNCGAAACINRYGSFECGCNPQTGGCDVHYDCRDDANCTTCDPDDSRICRACRPGWSPAPLLGIDSLMSCESTNECLTLSPTPTTTYFGINNTQWTGQLVCVDTPTSYRLECQRGYTLDETVSPPVCRDIDECAASPTLCGVSTEPPWTIAPACTNLSGGHRCACPSGYTQRFPGVCEDIDECSSPRCPGQCDNLPGSFACYCGAGTEGNLPDLPCLSVLDLSRPFCEGFGWDAAVVGQPASFRCYFVGIDGRVRPGREHVLSVTLAGLTPQVQQTHNGVLVSYVPPTADPIAVTVAIDGAMVGEVHTIQVSAGPACANPFDYQIACTNPVVFGPAPTPQVFVVNAPDTTFAGLSRMLYPHSNQLVAQRRELSLVRDDGVPFGHITLDSDAANLWVNGENRRVCLRSGPAGGGIAGTECPIFILPSQTSIRGDFGVIGNQTRSPDAAPHLLIGTSRDEWINGDGYEWSSSAQVTSGFYAHFGHDVIRGGGGRDILAGDLNRALIERFAQPVFGDDLIEAQGPSLLFGDVDLLIFRFGAAPREVVLGSDHLIGSDGDDGLYGDFRTWDPRDGAAGPTFLGGRDTLQGGAGNDILYGDAGPGGPTYDMSDVLEGGPGDDTIIGTTRTAFREAGDTYVFDLGDPRGFGDDILTSAGRGTLGTVSDTLRFLRVPDANGDGTVTATDLYLLTRASPVGLYTRIEVFADPAHTRRLGSFHLPAIVYFNPTLQGYPFSVEIR